MCEPLLSRYHGTLHAWTLVQLPVQTMAVVEMPSNCAARGYGLRCDLGTDFGPGESRSTEFKLR
jgi:hypothetical protein